MNKFGNLAQEPMTLQGYLILQKIVIKFPHFVDYERICIFMFNKIYLLLILIYILGSFPPTNGHRE